MRRRGDEAGGAAGTHNPTGPEGLFEIALCPVDLWIPAPWYGTKNNTTERTFINRYKADLFGSN